MQEASDVEVIGCGELNIVELSAILSDVDDDRGTVALEEEHTAAPAPKERRGVVVRTFDMLVSPVAGSGDTPEERMRKNILFPVTVVVIASQFAFAVQRVHRLHYTTVVLNSLRVVLCGFLAVYMIATKRLPIPVAEVCLSLAAILFSYCGDVLGYGKEEMWTLMIVIMDGILMSGCRPIVAGAVVLMTVVYLSVKTFEEGFGLGIYSAIPESWTPGLRPDEPQDDVSRTFFVLLIRVGVFVTDFLMTKKFAYGMRKEQQNATRSAVLAQDIAAALVQFDLDTAQRLVGDGEDDLRCAFRALLANLRLYRPYLPDALFNEPPVDKAAAGQPGGCSNRGPASYKTQRTRHVPPGLHEGSVSIVFTDIQSSTPIWEAMTAAMRDAMDIHNDTMRDCLQRHRGYEVKTIGDAFMVAFDTSLDAFRFAVAAQVELLAKDWPADLLKHPLCREVKAEDGTTIWRGLRVRIGIHTGPARLELNPTTGRTDYMGPTVNKAARVESSSAGGAITFTEEVHRDLSTATTGDDVETPFVVRRSDTELKGVGLVTLYTVVPTALMKRQKEIAKTLDQRQMKVLSPAQPPADCRSMRSSNPQAAAEGGPSGRFLVRNKFSLSQGTVATVRVDFSCLPLFARVVDGANEIVQFVLEAADRTESLVHSLCSNTIVLGWNAGRSCVMHVAHSAKFASHLHANVTGLVWSRYVTAGLTTGKLLHGSLGSHKQRFVTVIGTPVEMSRLLAAAAAKLSTFCLLSGPACAATDNTLQVHTRPVAAASDPQDTIYELNLESFQSTQGVWSLFDGPVAQSWGPVYKEAWQDQDEDVLEELAQGDHVVAHVLNLMRRKMPLVQEPPRGTIISPPAEQWLEEGVAGGRFAARRKDLANEFLRSP
ncbi:Adenylate cyclase [Diplonema papillatum]|nr:Adenylate cyclase [Diplonema papillatum]